MADVVKKPVGYSGASQYKMQVFTESDVSAGDIIRVDLCLGHDARQIVIEPTGGNVVVVFNAYEHVCKRRHDSQDGVPFTDHLPNLARKQVVLDVAGKPQVTVGDGIIYTENISPTRDIYVVSYTATSFNITVR